MADCNVVMRVTVPNIKALRALAVAARELNEVADAMPWQPGLRKAAKALKYAANNLGVEQVRK